MNYDEIMKKKAADRSDAENDFIKKEDAKKKEAADKKEADDKAAKEAAEKKEADDKKAAEDAAKIVADDKGMVRMSEAQYKLLTSKADEGAAAFAELKTNKLNAAVGVLVMSETNKKGRFLPKEEATLRTFMETLSDDQRKAFADLIGQLPEQKIFREVGDDAGAGSGSVSKEVDAKIATIQASDKAVSYSEALKRVFAETPGLSERYDKELQG